MNVHVQVYDSAVHWKSIYVLSMLSARSTKLTLSRCAKERASRSEHMMCNNRCKIQSIHLQSKSVPISLKDLSLNSIYRTVSSLHNF